MSFVNSPETLKNEIVSIFTDIYPTYQAQVDTLWNDGIELPLYKKIDKGDVNTPREIREWPTLAILSGDVFPSLTTQQRRDIFYRTRIYIRTFLRHANVAILDAHLDRTLQAQLLMLEEYPYSNLRGKANSLHFMLAEPTSSHNPAGSTQYMRALEVQFEVEHR